MQATLPGFALVAILKTGLDPVVPSVGIALVNPAQTGFPISFLWFAQGIAQFQITGSGGWTSGLQDAINVAGYFYTPAFIENATFTFTITGYDADGNPVMVNGSPVSASIDVTIMPIGFGVGPFGQMPFGL